VTTKDAAERLIVALDVPDLETASGWVAALGDSVTFYKIGMELACGGGLALVDELRRAGKRVFLDLKLHDIPNTVERATARIVALGATFLTVHAYPQTMAAAVAAAKGSRLGILAVTVLTSADDADLRDAGYAFNVRDLVARRARQAEAAEVAGLVASASEAAFLKGIVDDNLKLVTPGIRPAGEIIGDQKRVATPAGAIENGADYLVVGRPITAAKDPRAAAEAIIAEMVEALPNSRTRRRLA